MKQALKYFSALLLAPIAACCQVEITGQVELSGNLSFFEPAPAPAYTAYATTFAGDGQCYMLNTASFGGADANKGIFSVWVKFAQAGSTEWIVYANSGMAIYRLGDNKIYAQFRDASNTILVDANTTATITDANWHHIIVSLDRTVDNRIAIYLDGSESTTISVFLDTTEDTDPINYTAFQWNIGGTGSVEDMNGCVSELYMNLAEYIDLSIQANREQWRSSGGSPVNLGSDGSTPTGTAPRGYFKSEYSSFHVNSGTGGNFTKTGTTDFTSCTAP